MQDAAEERLQISSYEQAAQVSAQAQTMLEDEAPAEKYERGLALRKAGLFKQAVDEFEQAAASRTYALKAYAQIGLCHKSRGRHEEAVAAFRKALKSSPASIKETVQILYVLGRTLESLERSSEALEAYRWIRREDPDYRDVAHRIRQLSTRRSSGHAPRRSWVGGVLRSWQGLLRTSK
jgi:tetratricopeptide (TPR) repeat protein